VRRRCFWLIVLGLSGGLLADTSFVAQSTQKPMSPILTDSLVGRDLYQTYCAGCHGREGRGGGPVASALNTPPADLTTLARRSGGRYPATLVEATLNGARPLAPSAAHGASDMPIWGSIFRQLDAKESIAKVRIANLVKYVESIQVP